MASPQKMSPARESILEEMEEKLLSLSASDLNDVCAAISLTVDVSDRDILRPLDLQYAARLLRNYCSVMPKVCCLPHWTHDILLYQRLYWDYLCRRFEEEGVGWYRIKVTANTTDISGAGSSQISLALILTLFLKWSWSSWFVWAIIWRSVSPIQSLSFLFPP